MPIIPVESRDDPRLAPFAQLPARAAKRRAPIVAEGAFLVERLAAGALPLEAILCEPRHAERWREQTDSQTPIYTAPKEELEKILGFPFHRGVLAWAHRPPPPDWKSLLREALTPAVVPICVGVSDPQNIGLILRSAAALGAALAIVGPNCADPFARRVARTSMGANFSFPIYETETLPQDLRELQEAGFELVAAALSDKAERLPDFRAGKRTAVLLGGEGFGLSSEWIAPCSRQVVIPMQSGIDSLNVGVAAGILLHHIRCLGSQDN